jgi:alpha-beta hydrolase superfamily lysophospholipase
MVRQGPVEAGAGSGSRVPPDPEPVELIAADGVVVHATYRRAAEPRALILLFHQRGSSRAEYFEIGPRLAANGYSSLAIDQRGAGERWRVPNRTAEQWGETQSHLEAMPDLEAALAWGAAQGLKPALWGSSYSAALVFPLAAGHPGEVSAVLAFSPGDYVEGGEVIKAARELDVPVFISSATTLHEIDYAQPVFDAVASQDKEYFLPAKGGGHGSLTLIRAENPEGYEEMWSAVLAFLRRVFG